MKTIVATRNPDLQRDFARDLLRRRDLRLVTVENTRDLLARLRQGADLCFVDRVLSDGEGKDAAAAIRADKKLVNLPVLLMVTPGGPRPDDPRTQGFTDIVELPSPPGALTLVIGRWLGVALRDSDRRAVRVHVYSGDVASSEYLGVSVDLSEMGILLRTSTRRELTAGQTLALRFTPPGQSREATLRATVVRVDDKNFQPARGVALNFVEGDAEARAPLDAYLADLHGGWPFRVEVAPGVRPSVTLAGRLTEDADLRALASLSGEVDVRMRDLRGVNSDSAQRWRDLVLRTPAVSRWHLHECPVGFVHQANQNPSLLLRTEVESFHAPYACAGCGLEDERVITAGEAKTRRAPPFACRACNAQMHFDDLPDAFFAFVG